MLTVGIPSKGVSISLLRVLNICLDFPNTFEFIVSINPGEFSTEIPNTFLHDERFRIIYQTQDLGLYGNFRFLLSEARRPLFSWFCIDDKISRDIEMVCDSAIANNFDLTLNSWVVDEYDMTTATFAGEPNFGPLPSLESRYSRSLSSLNIDPSWMFGVWKTKFLQQSFPKRDFDWLDCELLQIALLNGNIGIEKNAASSIIGTHNRLGRLPNSIAPTGHTAAVAIAKQLSRLPRYFAIDFRLVKFCILRCWTLYNYSKYLNVLRKNSSLKDKHA